MSKTYIELFCGIGGVRCALDRFGWTCVLANDVSPTKCDIYERNYGDAELKHGDVSDITVTSFSGADLMTACFPCQDFSQAGKKRGFTGLRSRIITVVLDKLQLSSNPPKTIMLENVPGLLHKGDCFLYLMGRLVRMGYKYVDIRQLDASNFLPQSRRRVFIVVTKEWDGRCVAASDVKVNRKMGKPSSVISAMSLCEANITGVCWMDNTCKGMPPSSPSLQCMVERDLPLHPVPSNVTELINKHQIQFLNDLCDGTYRVYTVHGRGPCKQVYHVKKDDMSPCLRGSNTFSVLCKVNGRLCSRRMVPREYARLQGFPESFIIPPTVSPTQACAAFGDAVCVPVLSWLCENVLNVVCRQ